MVYPTLLTRVKAFIIDMVIMVLTLFTISKFFSRFDAIPTYVRVLAFLFVFFMYDPWLTSVKGGTIGHKFMHLKVSKSGSGELLNFRAAFVRSSIKALLGWLSLFTINKSEQKQAIHDIVVNSVITLNKEV